MCSNCLRGKFMFSGLKKLAKFFIGRADTWDIIRRRAIGIMPLHTSVCSVWRWWYSVCYFWVFLRICLCCVAWVFCVARFLFCFVSKKIAFFRLEKGGDAARLCGLLFGFPYCYLEEQFFCAVGSFDDSL